jgi:hypothetical protein
MTSTTTFGLAGILAALLAAPAVAHHAFAMFDQSKTIYLPGTVTHFAFVNPHASLHVAIANDKGHVSSWSFEGGSVPQLASIGWSARTFRAGDRVEVTFHPARDGSHRGQLISARPAN